MLENYFTYETKNINEVIKVATYSNIVLTKPIGGYSIGDTFESLVLFMASNEFYLNKGFGYRSDKFKINITLEKLN